MEEELVIDEKTKDQISKLLPYYGLSISDINKIFNDSYYSFIRADDISRVLYTFLEDENYKEIMHNLYLGYSIEQMESLKISKLDIFSFKKYLRDNNLTIDEVISIENFRIEKNIIINSKRGVKKEELLQDSKNKFINKLRKFDFIKNNENEIADFILKIDYTRPLYLNYYDLNKYLENFIINDELVVSLFSFLREINTINNIDEILKNIDKVLSKEIKESITLFLPIKKSYFYKRLASDNIKDLQGKVIDENNYLNASIFDDDKELEDDEVLLKLFVPKRSEGVYVESTVKGIERQEVLLNPSDLFITKVEDNIDGKTIVNALLLSKNRAKYKTINDEINFEDYLNKINHILENLSSFEKANLSLSIDGKENEVSFKIVSLINNEEKIKVDDTFRYDETILNDFIKPLIINYIRRIKVDKVNILPYNSKGNARDRVILKSSEKSTFLINNVSPVFSSEIEKNVGSIKPDLYFKKQIQKNHIHNTVDNDPLKKIYIRKLANGFVSIIIISSIVIIIGLLIILITIYV